MTSWLFQVGATRVFVTIRTDNAASAAVARRAGFGHEGTRRSPAVGGAEPEDVDVFAVLPDEWPPPVDGSGGGETQVR